MSLLADPFNDEAFAKRVGTFLLGDPKELLRQALEGELPLLKNGPSDRAKKFFDIVVKGEKLSVIALGSPIGEKPRTLGINQLRNLIDGRVTSSLAGKTDSLELDREYVAEAWDAAVALKGIGQSLSEFELRL